ncbi:MAG: TonB-dependent receptor [Tannerella sp.]|jgi:hypothetical protein|nr:TonB-dependent receptor [Tannerella sp.]
MKQGIVFYVIFILISVSDVFSQGSVTGTVKDAKDGSPVAFATAALLRPDSVAITGAMTDDEGQFTIDNVAEGNYLLQVSFIGYEKSYRTVNVPAQSDAGEIFLNEEANVLTEVVITGRRALVEQRLDRVVVNVSGNMITAGLNINDLLKQMPGLVVDQDGGVKLNGRPATVYIDGRPTQLPPTQVAQMLTGMMGDVVDRVELIDNPSSRYEAGLSSAIINIRLKRDASLGINGTAQAGIGFSENDFASRGGLNLNYRSKKVNIFGNYGLYNIPFYSHLYQIRHYNGSVPLTYDQHTLSRTKFPVHTVRAGLDWFVAPKHTIGVLFNTSFNTQKGTSVGEALVTQTGSSVIDSTILSNAGIYAEFNSKMYNLNYRYDGEKSGVFTADLDYGSVYNLNEQEMQSRYRNADGGELRPATVFRYSGPRNIDIYSFKSDYTKPLSDISNLEAGLKMGQTVTDNEIVYENLYGGIWVNDPNQSNRFKYTEQISAAYLTYNYRFGKFSAMVGLRAEYTETKGESVTMDTTFTHQYFDWFPSSYLQYEINEKQTLNLSYSRKINRPGYSMLNPFRSFSDPFTYQNGNPDLKPEYRNQATLRYNYGRYSVTLNYSIVTDVFSQDFIQDDENRTMGITQNNIGKHQQWYFGIYAPVQVVKWYSLNVSADVSYIMADTRHSGEKFLKNYWRVYGSLFHNFNFSSSFKANMQMIWSRPPWNGAMHMDDYWMMNAQMEKTFMDNRFSLSLSCNDIFSSLKVKGQMNFANINQSIVQDQQNRQLMLTVRYSFGSQQIRGARNRSVGIEEEMGRAR